VTFGVVVVLSWALMRQTRTPASAAADARADQSKEAADVQTAMGQAVTKVLSDKGEIVSLRAGARSLIRHTDHATRGEQRCGWP
jgi:hypothetical protein